MRKVNQNEGSKARRLLYLIAVNIDVACSGIEHNLATFVHFHFDLFIVLFDIDPGQCLHHGAQIQRSAELVQLPLRAQSPSHECAHNAQLGLSERNLEAPLTSKEMAENH